MRDTKRIWIAPRPGQFRRQPEQPLKSGRASDGRFRPDRIDYVVFGQS